MMNPCPEYTDNACCNPDQYLALGVQLLTSAAAFSKPDSGGCPACGENLRQLWCGLTCHPNQSLWVSPSRHHEMQDGYEVMPANVSLGSAFGCGMFDSCKDTQSAQQDKALSTGLFAFLNYMGRDQGKSHGVWYTFTFFDGMPPHVHDAAPPQDAEVVVAADGLATESGLVEGMGEHGPVVGRNWTESFYAPPVQYCCSYNASIYALNTGGEVPPNGVPPSGNLSSPCASCENSCAQKTCPAGTSSGQSIDIKALSAPLFGAWYGFEGVTVAALYGSIAFLTAVVAVVNCRSAKQSE